MLCCLQHDHSRDDSAIRRVDELSANFGLADSLELKVRCVRVVCCGLLHSSCGMVAVVLVLLRFGVVSRSNSRSMAVAQVMMAQNFYNRNEFRKAHETTN